MIFTPEDIAEKVASMGLTAQVNNHNHVTIIGGKRVVQIWTTGTVYSDFVAKKHKRFDSRKFHPISHAVEKAVELAKEGYIT